MRQQRPDMVRWFRLKLGRASQSMLWLRQNTAVILLAMIVMAGVACNQDQPAATTAPTPEPEPTARATRQVSQPVSPQPTRPASERIFATPVPTATPAPTATPILSPTPSFLTATEIFGQISPSIAYVATPTAAGSGFLIEGRYLVTNAHVVWPYDHVRVVFPDGSEHIDAPVIDLDLMVDLAVIGPLETDTDPVDLVDGEELSIGSEVFLVGYPGEVEEYPQPAITRGLISRLRQWESAGMTFFQTDAAVAGGQSGGVLVNNNAEVIGISGLSFSEAAFGLVTSAADVRSRIEGIIVGEDVDGLGQRRLASGGGRRTFTTILGEEEQSRLYVINEPVGTDLRIFVGSRSDEVLAFIASAAVGSVAALLTDPYAFFPEELWGGDTVIVPDGTATVTTTIDSPYFLLLSRFPSEGEPFFSDTANPVRVQVDSNHGLAAYTDPDDGRRITVGETIKANMDFPLDEDQFAIQLEEGDTVSIAVETIAFDALMTVSSSIAGLGDLAVDDDSGGGLFGLNPKLTFSAPYSGRFFIGVSDLNVSDVGGYSLTVSEASPEAAPGR